MSISTQLLKEVEETNREPGCCAAKISQRLLSAGLRIGRWVLKSKATIGQSPAWMCRCDCGVEKVVNAKNLANGVTRSCGCYNKEQTGKRNRTHGKSGTSIYTTWQGMLQRCYDKNQISYKYYGGRGIGVCERWVKSFSNFESDMGPRPSGTTLDRINNDGPYCPENCRWATQEQQLSNRSANKIVEFNGEPMILSKAARLSGVNYFTLIFRIESGISGAALFEKPGVLQKRPPSKVFGIVRGDRLTINELMRMTGLKRTTIARRIAIGCTDEELTRPVTRN